MLNNINYVLYSYNDYCLGCIILGYLYIICMDLNIYIYIIYIYIPAQPRLQEFLQQFKNRKIFWNSRNSPVVPVNSRNTRKFSQFSAFCPFSLFFHVYLIFHHHSRANVSRTSCTGHICPMNRSFDMFWVILFR